MGTLGTDVLIISLISGITQQGSDSSCLISVSLSYSTAPSDTFHIQQNIGYPHFLCTLFMKSENLKPKKAQHTKLYPRILWGQKPTYCPLTVISQTKASCPFSSVVQESACPAGDEEKAGGGSSAVHPEGWDTDCGSGSGQTGLGQGL